jgi:uroporphyrinogen decarboxylase
LNHKDRFKGVFEYKNIDRVPNHEMFYWWATIERWHREGLPQDLGNHDVEALNSFFGLEGQSGPYMKSLPVKSGFWPPFPERTIRREGDLVYGDDGMGGVFVRTSDGGESGGRYLSYPLKNREDWEKLRPFLSPDTPGRFIPDWDETIKEYSESECPVGIFIGSLYGWLRNWMGVKGISLAFYQDPEWVGEMMDTFVNLWISNIKKALKNIKVDFANWWEDMCYNQGPLLSVRHFEEFMVPRYLKVTKVLKEHGVSLNILDSDGNVGSLIPGWMKAGINCILPMEAGCNDIYSLRETFGKKLLFIGGINKLSLIKGEKSIKRELDRLTPLLRDGGYLPMVDHWIPPEVSFNNYMLYLKMKNEWINSN